MTEEKESEKPKLDFEVWKARLREDCERLDKMATFNCLEDECLRVLWRAGTKPSVQGIIEGGRITRLAS